MDYGKCRRVLLIIKQKMRLLLIVSILGLFSCRIKQSDTSEKEVNKEPYWKRYETALRKDSIKVVTVIQNHLVNKSTIVYDSLIVHYDYTIRFGKLFNQINHYLIIDRNYNERDKIYYIINNKKIEKIIEYSKSGDFLSDTIKDINEDGYLDVIVDIRFPQNIEQNMYLQNKENGLFTNAIKIPNPHYVPGEKIIMGYIGQNSSYRLLYKFRWNQKNSIDTLEWISYDSSLPNPKFLKSKEQIYYEIDSMGNYVIPLTKERYELLNHLPEEYKNRTPQ